MSKKSIRFFNDREMFMKGIDSLYYYEEESQTNFITVVITTVVTKLINFY